MPLSPTPRQVRGKLYELLANCIPPELILRQLLLELLKKLDDTLKVWDQVASQVQYLFLSWVRAAKR